MRTLTLSKSGTSKVRSHLWELKQSDFEEPLKSLTPGEWCIFTGGASLNWLGFVNPLLDAKYSCANVVSEFTKDDNLSPEDIIKLKISKAFKRRLRFKEYEGGSRIFYGASDGLPGLIIDKFENALVIQINTAGIDRYREMIKDFVQNLTKTTSYFLDNQKYREKESLPFFETTPLPELYIILSN